MSCSKENRVNITTPSGKAIVTEVDALIFFRRARKLESLDFMLQRLAERCNFSHLITEFDDGIRELVESPILYNVGHTLMAYQKREKEIKGGRE